MGLGGRLRHGWRLPLRERAVRSTRDPEAFASSRAARSEGPESSRGHRGGDSGLRRSAGTRRARRPRVADAARDPLAPLFGQPSSDRPLCRLLPRDRRTHGTERPSPHPSQDRPGRSRKAHKNFKRHFTSLSWGAEAFGGVGVSELCPRAVELWPMGRVLLAEEVAESRPRASLGDRSVVAGAQLVGEVVQAQERRGSGNGCRSVAVKAAVARSVRWRRRGRRECRRRQLQAPAWAGRQGVRGGGGFF